MSTLDLGLNEIEPMELAPEGEQELTIARAVVKTSDSGFKYINVILTTDPEKPWIDDIYHMLSLPSPDMDERINYKRRAAIKNFILGFGIEDFEIQTETDSKGNITIPSWVGKIGRGIVGRRIYQGIQSATLVEVLI